MMKKYTIGLSLICSVLVTSCLKEKGKQEYFLTLTFTNGEQVKNAKIIFEKPKNYDDMDNKSFFKDNKDIFILRKTGNIGSTYNYIPTDLLCYKTKEKKVIAENKVDLYLHNSAFTGTSSALLLGVLKFDGDYKRFGRKITVEEGTFSFEWYNAEDVGKQDTILTGTWSLKRD